MSGIPPITIGPISLAGTTAIYLLHLGDCSASSCCCAGTCSNSRQGRAIRSLRGGIAMVESLAINSFRMRLAVFVLAGLLAGLSGWLYAHMQRFVSPAPFDIRPGIELLLMALVGGAGHIVGAVVGAAIVTLLKNVLQDVLPAFTRYSAQLEIVVFGVLFIVLLQKRARRHRAHAQALSAARRDRPLPAQAKPLARRARPAVADQPVLTIERATKRFGALAAVNNVSFEVKPGEILGLIGPNGAGKSTLLNLITGDRQAERRPDRVPRRRHHEAAAARHIAARGIARTFQHVKLRPNMTLLDNVAARGLSAHAVGISRRRDFGSTAPRKGPRSSRRCGSCSASASARRPASSPATCRSASSACWKSRARSPPIRWWSCWTSRPPACAASRSSAVATCCAPCATRA